MHPNAIDDLLKDEYLHIQKSIIELDGRALTIKAWSVSFGLATAAAAFAAQSKWLFLISLISCITFWIVESFWKLIQKCFDARSWAIEEHFSNKVCLLEALQIDHYWIEEWKQRRWAILKRIVFKPHVMLPHIVVALLAILLFLLATFGYIKA